MVSWRRMIESAMRPEATIPDYDAVNILEVRGGP